MVFERVNIGWLAKNSLDRHRPVFMAMQVCLFIVGCVFWVDSLHGSMGFAREVFGWLAYSIPAKFWAFANMGAAAMCIIGLKKPVRHWMVAVGSFAHIVQFVILSYSAVFTGGAFVIGLYASVFFLPLHLWIFFEAAVRGR